MPFTVEIKGDTSDLDRALSDAQRQLETLDQTAKRVADDVVKGMDAGADATSKLKKEVEATTSTFGDMKKSLEDATRGFTDMEHAANAVKRVVQDVAEMSDEWTTLGNKIRSTGGDIDYVRDRVLGIADDTRTSLETTGELYKRLSGSLTEMGVGEDRVLGLTKELNEMFVTAGRTGGETTRAMIELSHAFSSGHVDGRVFRSLMIEMPDILRTVAKDLGVTVEELHEMAKAGTFSSETLVTSLENSKASIDAGFGKTAPTLSQQWTVLHNDLAAAVGAINDVTGAFGALGERVHEVAVAAKDASAAIEHLKSLGGGGGNKDSGSGAGYSDFTAPIGPSTGPFNPFHLYGEAKREREAQDQGLQFIFNSFDASDRLKAAADAGRYWEQVLAEANTTMTASNDQLKTFLTTTNQIAKDSLTDASQKTALWTEAANFLNDPLIKINGNLRSMADLWGDVKDAASGALRVPLAVTGLAKKVFGDDVGGAVAAQLLGPAPGNWENGDEFKFPAKSKGGPAVRDTNWVQSIMSDLGSYLGAGVGIAQGGLQQASGGNIDFYDLAGTFDRLKQQQALEAAHIQPGIHADEEGNLTLGGGLNGVITQVVQGMTDLVHQGLQWAGVDLWDLEKAKHMAEGLANMQRWNQELDGVRSKAAEAKKAEYEEFLIRTGDVSGGISVAFHKFSDDAMNSAKTVERAFTTAFDGIEKALINFVDTGKLELGDLAKQLEHLLLDLAFRQIVGGIGSAFGSGSAPWSVAGLGLGGGSSGGGWTDSGVDAGTNAAASAARAAPAQIHVHLGDETMTAAVSRPAVQSAITNVVYRQHGNVLSVRDRLRSRG
jgi:tape measure domain-containing protein